VNKTAADTPVLQSVNSGQQPDDGHAGMLQFMTARDTPNNTNEHGTCFACMSLGSTQYATALSKEIQMLGTILIVVLVLALLGVLPAWNHSRDWGYGPSGGFSLVIVVLLVLVLTGRL
jgi:hypothetical protein